MSAPRRRLIVRSAGVVAAVLAIGATPLVAAALDDDITTDPTAQTAPDDLWQGAAGAVRSLAEATSTTVPQEPAEPTPAAPAPVESAVPELDPEPAVDPVIVALVDTYGWDERGPRVTELQQALGVEVDGWYGWATRRAHLGALEAFALPVDGVPAAPEVVVPAGGPSAAQWAALRQCESGGNYSITNPSGKYRGAYQFDRPTWNSVAARHAPHLVGVDPAAAAPGDQDALAFALYGERGARPWPQCGRHL